MAIAQQFVLVNASRAKNSDLRVEKSTELITRKDVINNDRRPLTVLAQSQLVDALRAELASHNYRLQQLRILSDHRQRAHKPTHSVPTCTQCTNSQ